MTGDIRINVRPANENDSKALRLIINEIIEIGGTTAFESKLNENQFKSYFLTGENCLCCYLAEDGKGLILGFQSFSHHKDLPNNWVDIATIARIEPKVRGVGTKLFQGTAEFSRRSNIECINATIRADNDSGLRYYSKMGFVDYSVDKGVPLLDGTPVDRISKKYRVV